MSVKTYTLGKHKQLIDLNGDLTNFEITVTVTAKDPKSVFDIVVIDEASLNNSETLEYKQAVGTISSTIVNDNNIYKNYYVVMKADTPCQVDITLEKQEIAPKPIPQPPLTQSSPGQITNKKLHNIKPQGQINWRIILVIGGLVAVGLYFFVFSGNKKSTSSSYAFTKSTAFNSQPSIPVELPSIPTPQIQMPSIPTPSIPTSQIHMPPVQANVCSNPSSLFSKLSKLPIDD